MADNWDDSGDEWDADDDELDARLGLDKLSTTAPQFDEEEDLAVKEKASQEKQQLTELKKKGNALAEKKKAEQDRKREEELARKVMEMEAELEASLSPEELRELKQQRVEEADHALTNDLFGGVDNNTGGPTGPTVGTALAAGDTVELTSLVDHLKHASKVGDCMKVST